MDAKKYNRTKILIGLVKGAVSFVLLFIFILMGYNKLLENTLEGYFSNNYFLLIAFVIVIGAAWSLIFFPVNFYKDFILEHKYQLSNQTFGKWIWERMKGMLVGGVIGLPLLVLFYFILNVFDDFWWLPFAVIMFFISVFLAQIVPVLILPLFYKITPIEDKTLKGKITQMAQEAGITVENIYKFDMSKNTKKANAAFTGLCRTKRIILGDTLLDNFSVEEIETVIAHELGHYKHNHILKNIIINTLFSFAAFYILALLYSESLSWFGLDYITQISALPLLSLWGVVIGVIQTPLLNAISRKFEYEADTYSVNSTDKPEIFIGTLEKLTDQNLGDREPHPLVEWFYYSHPSIEKRKKNILSSANKPKQ